MQNAIYPPLLQRKISKGSFHKLTYLVIIHLILAMQKKQLYARFV